MSLEIGEQRYGVQHQRQWCWALHGARRPGLHVFKAQTLFDFADCLLNAPAGVGREVFQRREACALLAGGAPLVGAACGGSAWSSAFDRSREMNGRPTGRLVTSWSGRRSPDD